MAYIRAYDNVLFDTGDGNGLGNLKVKTWIINKSLILPLHGDTQWCTFWMLARLEHRLPASIYLNTSSWYYIMFGLHIQTNVCVRFCWHYFKKLNFATSQIINYAAGELIWKSYFFQNSRRWSVTLHWVSHALNVRYIHIDLVFLEVVVLLNYNDYKISYVIRLTFLSNLYIYRLTYCSSNVDAQLGNP